MFLRDPDSGQPYWSNCGGTLVASKYVITAAHCVLSSGVVRPANTVAIRIGDHDLNHSGEELITPKFVNVKAITIHPSYTGIILFGYDISIVELEEELDLDIYTPACLAKSDEVFDGKNATVAGWGLVGYGIRPNPLVPSEVAVPVTGSVCNINGNGFPYGSNILCTGHEGLGMSAYSVMT